MKIGNVDIFVLSDGTTKSDGGGFFGLVPKVLWEKVHPADELNRVPWELRSLLIVADGKKILVDTGYGDKLTPKQKKIFAMEDQGDRRLLGELERLGVTAAEIDIVINTHLHSDHCGGNTMFDGDNVVATFPNARYIVQRREIAQAMFPNERTRGTYFKENFLPLLESGAMEIVDGDYQVTPSVRTMVTRGHTPGHQVVIVESEGKSAIFLADACSWAVHMERLAWVPSFDIEPMESIQTKKRLRDWALRRNALLIFQHDPTTVFGRVRPGEKPGTFVVVRQA